MMTADERNNTNPASERVTAQIENDSNDSVNNSVDNSESNRKTGFIVGRDSELKEIEYTVVDGKAFFEDCILLGTAEEIEQFSEQVRSGAMPRGAGIDNENTDRLWPNGRIPYVIHSSVKEKGDKEINGEERVRRIKAAIKHWEENTPIRFDEYVSEDAEGLPENYVRIEDKKGSERCFATLGRNKWANNRDDSNDRNQVINLGNKCYGNPEDGQDIGTIIHEIGHTVGLYHEQSRDDRDDYVKVNTSREVMQFRDENNDGENDISVVNFSKDAEKRYGDYDYDSIMHYDELGFSKDGKIPVIEPVDKEGKPLGEEKRQELFKRMGQRKGLSSGDIATVKEMYTNVLPADRITNPEPNPEPAPEPPQPTQETDIVPVYQYFAEEPWRFLYDTHQSEDFIKDGWKPQGIAFQAFGPKQAGVVPVHRFAADGDRWRHMLLREDRLSGKEKTEGWMHEDIVFYAFATENPDIQGTSLAERLQPVYQYVFIDADGQWRYQYSLDPNIGDGWEQKGPVFFALPPTDS